LDVARRLAEAGVTRDAAEAMRQADRGVGELRERLDRAAQSVLGDEAEALRRASEQLRDLADEINREIETGRGSPPDAEEGETPDGPDRAGQAERRPGPGADETQNQPSNGSGQESPDAQEPTAQQGAAGRPGARGDQDQPASGGAGNNPNEPADGEVDPTGEQNDGANQQGNRSARDQGQNPTAGGARAGGDRFSGLEELFRDGGRAGGPGGPITGEHFRDWADRMRDVEDMLDDSALSAEAARIRDRAQQARVEFKRHSRPPDWTQLQDLVAEPLSELRLRIAEEIRRHESPDSLAPIDRDSAPAEFADQIRTYYQRLGSGE
jgi:hypothetical protein